MSSRDKHSCHYSRIYEVYTDGSSSWKKKDAAWAFVAYRDGKEIYSKSGYMPPCDTATNSKAELMGMLEFFRSVRTVNQAPAQFLVFTDSRYVIYCIHGLRRWKAEGRQTKHIEEIEEIVSRLESVSETHSIKVRWVKGHSGNEGNERADFLATTCRKEAGGG